MPLNITGQGSIDGITSLNTSVSSTELGYLDGVTSALQSQLASKLPIAGGKILQIVRATDTSERTTTSLTFVDVTGMSVTITPQFANSNILLLATFQGFHSATTTANRTGEYRITDNSNNTISGAQRTLLAVSNTGTNHDAWSPLVLSGWASPNTTSAVTYKMQFAAASGANSTVKVHGNFATSQLFAIEVSA